MAIQAAQLVTKIAVEDAERAKQQVSDYGKTVDKTQESSDRASHGIRGMFKEALAFAGGQAIFAGIGFLKDQIGDVFKVTEDHQDVMAQLASRLHDTAGAAGLSASAIEEYAKKLSEVTPFSKDAILQGDNMLLTFKSIGKDVLPQATHTMVELSQVMGGDMQGAAVMLGKAMDDPIQGITALHRVGVSFDDATKNSIKTMVEHGNVAGAQKIILQNLAQQGFGTAAEAAGKTFSGQLAILKNHFDELKETIGTHVMPILANFLGFIQGTAGPAIGNAFKNLLAFLQPFGYFLEYVGRIGGKTFKDIGDTLQQVGQIFKSVFSLLGGGSGSNNPLYTFMVNLLNVAYPIVRKLADAFQQFIFMLQSDLSTVNPQQIIGFFAQIGKAFNDFKGYVMPVLQQVGGILGGQLKQDFQTVIVVVKELIGWWQTAMVPAIKQALPGFLALGNVLFTKVFPALAQLWADGHKIADALLPVIIRAFETLAPIVVKIAGFIAEKLAPAIAFLTPYIVQAAGEVVKFAQDISTRVSPIITRLGEVMGTTLDFIKAHWSQIWGALAPFVMGAFNVIKGIIQIAWSVITGIFKIGADLITGNWGQLWTDLKDTLHGVWDGIVSIVKGGVDIVIGFINDMINGINTMGIDIGPVHIHPHIPQIPLLDIGGDILSTGLAVVHKGERVLPASVAPHAQGAGSGQPPIINVYLDGAPVAKKLMPHIVNNIRYAVGSHL